MTKEEIMTGERRLLGLLCQGGTEPRLREELLSRLRSYAFRHLRHQVLFDCLREMPQHRPEFIAALLPAWLTRAGFPDVDLTAFLEPCPMTRPEALALLGKLMASQEVKME